MIGANWDVTEQKIGEEQRAIIIESAPNGMMIVDETGTITLANLQVEQTFGYARGGLAGVSVETLVPDNIRAAHGSTAVQCCCSGLIESDLSHSKRELRN
jgi:PAS domain S-box-containing protein